MMGYVRGVSFELVSMLERLGERRSTPWPYVVKARGNNGEGQPGSDWGFCCLPKLSQGRDRRC